MKNFFISQPFGSKQTTNANWWQAVDYNFRELCGLFGNALFTDPPALWTGGIYCPLADTLKRVITPQRRERLRVKYRIS
jgi:hypothetical protein